MTYKEMRDQVMQWLGLQDITSYDESALASQLIYAGTIDMLSRTRCVVRCIDLRVLADVPEYTLDNQVLALIDVEDGARRRLRRDQRSGVFGFAVIGANILRVIPTPSEDGEIQVWAVKKPQPMSADTDSLSFEQFGGIPDEYHDAVVTYALWKGADYADDVTTQGGEYYRILYEGQDGHSGRISQIKQLVNKRGTARGSRMQVRLKSVSSPGAYT